MQTGRRRPERAAEVGRAAAKRAGRLSVKPGGGARGRARGARGPALCTCGRAARRKRPAVARQPPATTRRAARSPGRGRRGRGRRGLRFCGRARPAEAQDRSPDDSAAGKAPATLPGLRRRRRGGRARPGLPQPSPGPKPEPSGARRCGRRTTFPGARTAPAGECAVPD